jgi:hypothetical protein
MKNNEMEYIPLASEIEESRQDRRSFTVLFAFITAVLVIYAVGQVALYFVGV